MSTHGRSLHSKTVQVVDSTLDILSLPSAAAKVRHFGKVTFSGCLKEKIQKNLGGSRKHETSKQALEAIFICIALLCLLMTGCSGWANGGSDPQGSKQFLQASGEANVPPAPDVRAQAPPAPEVATPTRAVQDSNGKLSGEPIKRLALQDAVVSRVRTVTGWLKFVKQEHAASLVEQGWTRVASGKILSPPDKKAIPGFPEISTVELMLWREVLRTSTSAQRPDETGFETLAVLLTTAKVPEDLLSADQLLVVSEYPAQY